MTGSDRQHGKGTGMWTAARLATLLRKSLLVLAGLVLLAPAAVRARDLGDLAIPPDRVPLWSPGVEGGIPDTSAWPVVNAADFGAVADDDKSDAPAINAAIEAVAKGGGPGIVQLDAGTYRFDYGTSILLKSNVVLRGAGMHRTVIAGDRGGFARVRFTHLDPRKGPWGAVGAIHVYGSAGPDVGVTSAALPRGAAAVEVADASGLSEGDYVYLWQNENDPAYIQHRTDWAASHSFMTHIFRITGKAGSRIAMDRPLRHEFDTALDVRVRRLEPIQHAGFEDLTVMNDRDVPRDYISLVNWDAAVNCWARNVFFYNGQHMHVVLAHSARNTIEHCLFERLAYAESIKDERVHPNNYSMSFSTGAVDNLVTNDVFVNLYRSALFACGANGNVFSYNYHAGDRLDDGIYFHGHYPHSNLVEGNDTRNEITTADRWWGQQGPRNTFFRNRVRAPAHIRNSIHGGPKGTTIVAHQMNLVGNVAYAIVGVPYGSYEDGTLHDYDQMTTGLWAERNIACDSKRGPHYGFIMVTPEPTTTLIENFQGEQAPEGWKGFRMPASLYLDGPPGFWPAGKPWPAIGADVDDFGNPGRLVKLPAQEWYEATRPLTLSLSPGERGR